MNRVVGLIPAKGLSDRIPYKNLASFGGRPLIEWTIEAALDSSFLDLVTVSTEDSRVAAIARHSDVEVIERPKSLATPTATTLDVIMHALDHPAFAQATTLVLLQPTSPLRTAQDIDAACGLLEATGGDAVISVVPAKAYMAFSSGHAGRLRPVDTLYVENGAVWALRTEPLRQGVGLYGGVMYGYHMPAERSVDIDTLGDLEAASALLGELTHV